MGKNADVVSFFLFLLLLDSVVDDEAGLSLCGWDISLSAKGLNDDTVAIVFDTALATEDDTVVVQLLLLVLDDVSICC